MNTTRLIKKSGVYFIGNFASKIMVALLVPIYAFFVSSADLGTYDYLQTYMNILVSIAFLVIWEAELRFIIGEKNKSRNELVTAALTFSLAISLVVSVAIYIVCIYKNYNFTIAILTSLMYSSYGLSIVWQYLSRAFGENSSYVKAGIIGTVVNFALILLLVCLLKLGTVGLIVSYALGRVTIIAFLEYKIRVFSIFNIKSFRIDILIKMLKYSSPLVLNQISAWLLSGFSRVIIMKKMGSATNGIFAFVDKFSALFISVGSIVVMALIEEAIIEYKQTRSCENISDISNGINRLFWILATLSLPVIFIFYLVIKSTEYSNSFFYVPISIAYGIFCVFSSVVGSIFQIIDKTRYQFLTTLCGGFVTVIISTIFINKYGLMAVMISQLLGAIVMFVSRILFVNRYISFKISYIKFLLSALMYIIVSILLVYTNNTFIAISLFLVLFCYYIYTNRMLINNFLKKMKHRFKT